MPDSFLEGLDLNSAFIALTFIGFVLMIYIAQAISHRNEDAADPWWLRNSSRFGRYLVALCLLWMLQYGLEKNWQPWPPVVALLLAFDLMLANRVVAIFLHMRRMDRRWPQKNVIRP